MKTIYTNGTDEYRFIEKLKDRNRETGERVTAEVRAIIEDVRREGDDALDRYTLAFDGFLPAAREVPADKLAEAVAGLDPELVEALERAAENIRDFHRRQLPAGYEINRENGVILGRKCRGLHRVGLYVPGGRAAYPSTVLMNVIPAKIAGVGEIIMTTPPQRDGWADPAVLAAAAMAGVDRVFLVGGAQAVAAMACGTATIPAVDKIVGPGNIYVATAKKLMYGEVDIDMIAGPSEILVLADETANPAYIAADLLSQAEHDVMASAMLVTHSPVLAEMTVAEIGRQKERLSRKDDVDRALADYGAVLVTGSVEESIKLANLLAPEHLEVMLPHPMDYVDRLQNAGSLFLGDYSPEPLGDYFAGPNHVLPTGFTARFFSPLSVESFMKYYSYTCYPREALREVAPHICRIAAQEGLDAHAAAIRARTEETQ